MEKSFYKDILSFDFEQRAAICSVLEWEETIKCKDYSHILVLESGEVLGTIGGREMEYFIVQNALEVIKSGKPDFRQYNFQNVNPVCTDCDCEGLTGVLVEQFTPAIQTFWREVDLLNPASDLDIVVHEIEFKESLEIKRYNFTPESRQSSLCSDLVKLLEDVRNKKSPTTRRFPGKFYHIQPIVSPPVLHIIGAGQITEAMAQLAKFIDLDVFVYDERNDLITPDRYPDALKLVSESLDEIMDMISFASQDFIIVVERDLENDTKIFEWLLNQQYKYLGIVSSKHYWSILSKALAQNGVSNEKIDRVFNPIGLEIEARTVQEVAISIIAELVLFYRKGKRKVDSFKQLHSAQPT